VGISKEGTLKKVITLCWAALILVSAAAAQVKNGQTVYVAVKSLPLKSGTGFFVQTTGILAYGDPVTVVQTDGKWVEVRYSGRMKVSGWTAQTSLTTKRIVAAESGGSIFAKEAVMPGIGFNEEVENVYRETSGTDYSALDAVEAARVSDDELLSFIAEGRLSMGNE
jgi:uncharacterized protein YgiM (DUF1202 family)